MKWWTSRRLVQLGDVPTNDNNNSKLARELAVFDAVESAASVWRYSSPYRLCIEGTTRAQPFYSRLSQMAGEPFDDGPQQPDRMNAASKSSLQAGFRRHHFGGRWISLPLDLTEAQVGGCASARRGGRGSADAPSRGLE